MRILVTGASGWIGSAVVPELLGAGHEVLGVARSEAAAAALADAGAEVRRGDLDDPDGLRTAAADCDGVIHLAYNHDFSDMAAAAATDRRAIEAFGAALEGSDRPLVIASGTLGLSRDGRVATERDQPDPGLLARADNARATLELAGRGVRSVVVRLSPSVHGDGDQGFVPYLIQIARDAGAAGYVGDGANRWTAVHRLDAARLFRLAVESAPPASVLHGVADKGVATRDIAAAIGRGLDIPATSIPEADVQEHFGWIGPLFAMDSPASNAITRELLGWEPTHPGLIEDLDAGHYFAR